MASKAKDPVELMHTIEHSVLEGTWKMKEFRVRHPLVIGNRVSLVHWRDSVDMSVTSSDWILTIHDDPLDIAFVPLFCSDKSFINTIQTRDRFWLEVLE